MNHIARERAGAAGGRAAPPPSVLPHRPLPVACGWCWSGASRQTRRRCLPARSRPAGPAVALHTPAGATLILSAQLPLPCPAGGAALSASREPAMLHSAAAPAPSCMCCTRPPAPPAGPPRHLPRVPHGTPLFHPSSCSTPALRAPRRPALPPFLLPLQLRAHGECRADRRSAAQNLRRCCTDARAQGELSPLLRFKGPRHVPVPGRGADVERGHGCGG